MKAIIPFKFFIQWENHTIPQSQEQELWGSRTILWKVQELLPWNKLIFWTDKGERCSKSPEQPYSILNLSLCHCLRMKMATGANIKQGNSRGSSTIFLHLQGIGSSCPCRGSTLLQTSARTTYHSSISANFKTKWGKRELLAASSISFLIKLYCLRKGDRTELAHVPHSSSSDGWQDLSKDSEWGYPHRWMSPSTRTVLPRCRYKTGERATASTPVLSNREFSSNPLAHARATPATVGHSAPRDLPSRGRKWGSVL